MKEIDEHFFLSSKLKYIQQTVVELLTQDPTLKILLFTQWIRMLELLKVSMSSLPDSSLAHLSTSSSPLSSI